MNESEKIKVGQIGNYYGGLFIKSKNGFYYWGIENYDGIDWEEIPERLYEELLKYCTEEGK